MTQSGEAGSIPPKYPRMKAPPPLAKPTNPLRVLAAAILVSTVAAVSSAPAFVTIISDTFTGGGDGVLLTGRAPETNLPGGTWVGGGSNHSLMRTTTTAGFGNPGPAAFGNHQNNAAVSIASSGTYLKPTLIRISADLQIFDLAGPAADGRGIGLGFYSTTGGQFSQNRFTGLVLDINGNLNLVQDPNATGFYNAGSFRDTPVAFVGTWDPQAPRTLTYDIDTTTGQILNISLEGSSADYSSFHGTTLFTDAATAFAGVHTSSSIGSTGANPRFGAFDNFSVIAVPEPSAATLLCLGLLTALGRRRRA